MNAAAAAKSLQSCRTLPDPRDSSPPGCLIPGILQARTLEWVALESESEVAQSCLTLSDFMDCSLPGSSIHGIYQARMFEYLCAINSRVHVGKHNLTTKNCMMYIRSNIFTFNYKNKVSGIRD